MFNSVRFIKLIVSKPVNLVSLISKYYKFVSGSELSISILVYAKINTCKAPRGIVSIWRIDESFKFKNLQCIKFLSSNLVAVLRTLSAKSISTSSDNSTVTS